MYSTNILDDLYYSYSETNYMNNYQFWNKVDKFDEVHLVLWCNRLTKGKYLSNDSGEDWIKMMSIVRLIKNPDIEKISVKQKRFCVLTLLKYWNHMSSFYVI